MAERRFAYHRAVAPMMWALVAIACIELVLVHLVVVLLLGGIGAAVVSAATLAVIAWLVVGVASMKGRPVVLGDATLLMRAGRLKAVAVPLADVAGVRTQWDADALRDRSVLKLSLAAHPNVIVDLVRPRPGRRGVRAIAHRLDDPAAFVAAIARLSPPR